MKWKEILIECDIPEAKDFAKLKNQTCDITTEK